MQNKINLFLSLFLLTLSLAFISCSDDNGNNPNPIESSSVYVTNEGNFSDSNGSVTNYEPDDGTTVQAAFEDANGRPFGGIIQSSRLADGQLYLVSNMADKIEVVDAATLESTGTIEMSASPSAIEVIDEETALVTTLDNNAMVDSVTVVDLANMQETDRRVPVGDQPRSIVRVGNKAYVANNGFGSGNTLTLIDLMEDTVTEIEVGHGPSQMVVDSEDRLWVVCSGRVAYDENFERDPDNDLPGSVHILDGNNGTVIDSVETGGHPSRIALNDDRAEAYLLNDGVSVIDMNTFELQQGFIDGAFNAIGYFSAGDQLYLGQSRGYDQEGQALIYSLDGAPVDSFAAGIAPNGFQFHQ